MLARCLTHRSLATASAVLLAAAVACSTDTTDTINQPFRVDGVRVAPESLNTFLVARRGFTSQGGEMRCAYTPLGQEGLRVFVWAVCTELTRSGDRLVEGSGMSVPVAFTLEVLDSAARVVRMDLPEDGDRYGPSARRIFPRSVWPRIFATGSRQRAHVRALEQRLRADASTRLGLARSADHAGLDPGIRTNHDRYTLTTHDGLLTASIIAELTNRTAATIFILNCNGAVPWSLQQLQADTWSTAWTAEMDACLSDPIALRPGAVLTDTLTLTLNSASRLNPGTYRILWHGVLTSFSRDARPFGAEVPLQHRVSNPFQIGSDGS
jgi:hypothetical protein